MNSKIFVNGGLCATLIAAGLLSGCASQEPIEAVSVLAAALEKTGCRAEGLPQALLETQDFEGLIGTISLDEYGDVVRTQFLVTVQNERFVTLAALEPAAP